MPRLDHLLARNLGGPRAEARRLIAAGALTDLAGAPITDPRHELAALPWEGLLEGDRITLYDAYHLALHKPAGTLSALTDARHPVAYTLLRDAPLHPELRPVGRLDLETTGLLLWTTDGQWLHRLTHPRHAVPRTYQAALARPFRAADVAGLTLADGHRPQIGELVPLDPSALHPALPRPADADAYATITIIGGAYHEVRRIFAALGNHVLALCRVRFGNLALPDDLPPGAYRAITPEEV